MAAERQLEAEQRRFIRQPEPPTDHGRLKVCSATYIGNRGNQEDRFVYSPQMFDGEYAWFGVFDGTVKEHASEWIHRNILEVYLRCPKFLEFHALSPEEKANPDNIGLLEQSMHDCYVETDRLLIEEMRRRQIHYSACTSVTCIIHIPTATMVTAHIGDSHAILGVEIENQLVGVKLTHEHKPDHQLERQRIEHNGGSLIYLKSNRPFIRGGDFKQRVRAMQLNYSRAFGGKDLKMYGLSSEPSITTVQLAWNGRAPGDGRGRGAAARAAHSACMGRAAVLILGSDGIWDVIEPTTAVDLVMNAQAEYDAAPDQQKPLNCAERLARLALLTHEERMSNDNVTAVVSFFQ